jgi:hypothetical protein
MPLIAPRRAINARPTLGLWLLARAYHSVYHLLDNRTLIHQGLSDKGGEVLCDRTGLRRNTGRLGS